MEQVVMGDPVQPGTKWAVTGQPFETTKGVKERFLS
jgi:hypothetical protein